MKRSLKREVPPVPEAGGRNSEFSRSRLGVGVRRGWSTPSSGKKRGRPTGARSPDASTIRTGGRFTNTAVPKVKWMGGRDGGATAICASGGGGPQCGPANARGGACQLRGTFPGSLELLLFIGKVGGVQKKIRECNSPNRSGSCHGVGDFSGPGVRRYGYLMVWVPETGWSGTGLLRTNGVVGCDVT